MSVSATDGRAGAVPAVGQSSVRRQMAEASRRIKRLKRVDRLAVGVITFGGIGVVLSVVGILVFIGAEAIPLFKGASVRLGGTLRPGQSATPPVDQRALGSDEFGRYIYMVEPEGKVVFYNRESAAREVESSPPSLAGVTVTTASRSLLGDFVAAGTGDGRAVLLQVRFVPVHAEGAASSVKIDVRERGVAALDPEKRAIQRISYLEEGDRKFVAGQVGLGEIAL